MRVVKTFAQASVRNDIAKQRDAKSNRKDQPATTLVNKVNHGDWIYRPQSGQAMELCD